VPTFRPLGDPETARRLYELAGEIEKRAREVDREGSPANSMSDNDSIRFRNQAEEATEQAAKSISPVARETWLRIAEEWLKLVQSVEGRR
jgi:hypothetical protein